MNQRQLEEKIHEFSIKYTLETDKNYLKQFGQFFTLSSEIMNELIENDAYLLKNEKLDILEPSAGTGCIILECIKHFKNFSLDAIEIDKNIYNKTKSFFNLGNTGTVNFINDDFLNYDFKEKRYDLIIGNPPYFEMKKKMILEEFNEIVLNSGRINIYSLFIYKCIKLLKPNGKLYFIIPKTILSGKYFSKLRLFIHENCNILDIIKFDNNKLFKKVLQSVIILKIQLRNKLDELEKRNKFVKYINDNIYFVKDLSNLYLGENTTTISELNCIVKTGNIVWNQHKELLKDTLNEKNCLLIHSSNIKKNNLIINTEKTNKIKKQYMVITEQNKNLIITGPYIVINRIVGLDPPKLNIYFEKTNKKCFIENHVNYIKGPITNLTRIYNSLIDSKTITFIKELIGNTQLSQYELENIIPIF